MKITKRLLYKLYWEQNKTQREIANKFNCSRTPIQHLLKKYNIKQRHNAPRPNPEICLSKNELEILQGGLLGDGNLSLSTINARFEHKVGQGHKGHEIYLHNNLSFLNNRDVKSYKEFSKKNDKFYRKHRIWSLTSPMEI